VISVPVTNTGVVDMAALADCPAAAALVIQQPNFFGLLEDVDALTDWAHGQGALTIATVNPLSTALLKPPGEWGSEGADIACGDGQPFGIPMASGGPSFGFMCARQSLVRQMPGRIIGRTEDLDGKTGFALTLQAREQHIRRGKATSNICTNQGLLVTAGTIYLSLLGPKGLTQVASVSHNNTTELVAALTAIDGVSERFSGPYFNERVLQLPLNAATVVERLLEKGVLGGLALGGFYPDMDNALLVCATEKRTAADIALYAGALAEVLS
jgi:glycine dehydrogenase subunit 1